MLYVDQVVSKGDRLVAFGQVGQSEFDENYVLWYSSDGTNWSRFAEPSFDGAGQLSQIFALFATSHGFIAFADVYEAINGDGWNAVLSSPDGRDWQVQRVDLSYDDRTSFGQIGDTLVAYDERYGLSTSTDGITWTATTAPDFGDRSIGFRTVDGQLLAVGQQKHDQGDSQGTIYGWESSDGSNWTPMGALFGDSDTWPSWGPTSASGVLAFLSFKPTVGYTSNQRQIWIDRDGTWSVTDMAPRGASGLVSTSAGFAAFGQCSWSGEDPDDGLDSGVFWVSPDGNTWSFVDGSERGWSPQMAFQWNGRLILMGHDEQRYYADQPDGAVWVADLPPNGELWPATGRDAPTDVCART